MDSLQTSENGKNVANNDTQCELKLNIKLKKYSPLSFIPYIIGDTKKKFITTLYGNNGILMRAEYIVIGTYSKEKNVWIWSDQSLVLHKKMVKNVIDLKCTIMKNITNISNNNLNSFQQFIENAYSIIPISVLFDNLCILETFLGCIYH
jgi:hypothetical protein